MIILIDGFLLSNIIILPGQRAKNKIRHSAF